MTGRGTASGSADSSPVSKVGPFRRNQKDPQNCSVSARNRVRKLGRDGGRVPVRSPLPGTLSKLHDRFSYNARKTRGKECFSRFPSSPLHESVGKGISNAAHSSVREAGWRRGGPCTSGALTAVRARRLGETRGRELEGCFSCRSQPAAHRSGVGGPGPPSDLKRGRVCAHTSAHGCPRRSREAAGRPRPGCRSPALTTGRHIVCPAKRNRGYREPEVRRVPDSTGPRLLRSRWKYYSGHSPHPPPLAPPRLEMKEFGGSGCVTALPQPNRL